MEPKALPEPISDYLDAARAFVAAYGRLGAAFLLIPIERTAGLAPPEQVIADLDCGEFDAETANAVSANPQTVPAGPST